jgi:glycine dehydrogenase
MKKPIDVPALGFDPQTLPRELKRHYISASEEDIRAMLGATHTSSIEALFDNLPPNIRFSSLPALPEERSYEDLQHDLAELAAKNRRAISFLGDGLQAYSVPDIVPFVSTIRNLTTAYTPYQPERSQGTLITQWIYQCVMASLTGFEAVNASLYDRSTALFEALCASARMQRKNTVILCKSLYPGDIEVIETLASETDLKLLYAPINPTTGLTCINSLKELAQAHKLDLAAIAFPQINHFGLVEDADTLTDSIHALGALSIAVIDPMLLASGGLRRPAHYGTHGADIIVGEAQHLAIGPNFGGPGLGLFGVRHNSEVKNHIRNAPGRFVGKARDADGKDCFVMVLSTREQHIRQEKATSNICSNQAFLATLVGAAVLARGEIGMSNACRAGFEAAHRTINALLHCKDVALAFPKTPFFNECVLTLPEPATVAIAKGCAAGLHIGIDISERFESGNHYLKLSFTDLQTAQDCQALIDFFKHNYGERTEAPKATVPSLSSNSFRREPLSLGTFSEETLKDYYLKLGSLNISPDYTCYPLGSCTMKYNPYINDWAANLPGFTQAHPQAPTSEVQGCLKLLFETQEWFKKITGLAGVTTQPVAGAQGELVGLKLFQAYHRDHSTTERTVIFIPESAHGTNFATAMMAGFGANKEEGIIRLKSGATGEIDLQDLDEKLAIYGPRLCGIMVTNPNTCGIFESRFKTVAEKVHAAGGLVYMDGANMNAIACWVDLGALGVDAVHNNLHKTWTIPHGGGGPGDAIVAVSERLLDYLPGKQIVLKNGLYEAIKPRKSIGSFHRHWGNFAHKIRCYAYLLRLGALGIRQMAALSVLSARYLFNELRQSYPTLPSGAQDQPRMHEFILTLDPEDFQRLEAVGIPKAQAIGQVGKLFLDFGFHAPTVAWPEPYGLMIEPTESYTKAELDRFAEAVVAIHRIIREFPEALKDAPRFTPVRKIDEVSANRALVLSETLSQLPTTHANRLDPALLIDMPINTLFKKITQG